MPKKMNIADANIDVNDVTAVPNTPDPRLRTSSAFFSM